MLRKIVISTLLLVFSLGLLFWSYAAQQLDLLASFDFVQLSENDKAQKVFLETYIFDLFQTEFWSQVFRSLCIAIWVTIFLTFTIDSVKNRQMTQIFDQRIHSISQSVFKGAFSVNFPDEIIEETVKSVLEFPFYHDEFDYNIILKTASNSDKGYICEIVGKFDVHNETSSAKVYETSLRFDGHKHEDYKNHTAVLNVQYRKSDTSEYQLAANQAAIKKCNEDIKNSDEKTHTLKLNNRKIPKNDKIGLLLKRKVWKEKNDNHVFRSKIPGLGMKVKLTNETGEDISVGIASIHRDSFVEIDNGVSNNWEWKLDHPTLPQNGFVVYWRRIEI